MSHGICNRCGHPIAEPAPDYVRCGGPHPRLGDMWQHQAAEAAHRQMQRAREASYIDRTGWTDDQWIDDAERLMNEPDGAITSLVNGHVMALIRRVRGMPKPMTLTIQQEWDEEFGEGLVYPQALIESISGRVERSLDIDYDRFPDLDAAVVRGLDDFFGGVSD